MTHNVTMTAAGPQPTLTVNKTGTGSGTVTSSPSGINCGSTCSAQFAQGTAVTLTANPTAGGAATAVGGRMPGTGTAR